MRSFSIFSASVAAALVIGLVPFAAQAQDKSPAAEPATEGPKVPAKAEAAAPAKLAAKPAGERKSRRQQDARHCLEQPNNTAIIKCAEAYL